MIRSRFTTLTGLSALPLFDHTIAGNTRDGNLVAICLKNLSNPQITIVAHNTINGVNTGVKADANMGGAVHVDDNIMSTVTKPYDIPASSTGIIAQDMTGLSTSALVVSCTTGSISSGTSKGRYKVHAKLAYVEVEELVGASSVGTCSGNIIFFIPATGASAAFGNYIVGREGAKTGLVLLGTVSGNLMSVLALGSNGANATYTSANGWQMDLAGTYEAQ